VTLCGKTVLLHLLWVPSTQCRSWHTGGIPICWLIIWESQILSWRRCTANIACQSCLESSPSSSPSSSWTSSALRFYYLRGFLTLLDLEVIPLPCVVVHACNLPMRGRDRRIVVQVQPSYSDGRDRRILVWGQLGQSVITYFKSELKTKGLGMWLKWQIAYLASTGSWT
jgi:hypothetical protein